MKHYDQYYDLYTHSPPSGSYKTTNKLFFFENKESSVRFYLAGFRSAPKCSRDDSYSSGKSLWASDWLNNGSDLIRTEITRQNRQKKLLNAPAAMRYSARQTGAVLNVIHTHSSSLSRCFCLPQEERLSALHAKWKFKKIEIAPICWHHFASFAHWLFSWLIRTGHSNSGTFRTLRFSAILIELVCVFGGNCCLLNLPLGSFIVSLRN